LLNNGVAFVPALVGIFCFRKFKNSEVRYFIYFSIYVAVFQFLGIYPAFIKQYEIFGPFNEMIVGTGFEKNYWFYTLFWSMGSALFYAFYFQRILNRNHSRIIKILLFVFLISSLIYILFGLDDFFTRSIPYIKIFGAVIILLCTIFYFIEILKSDLLLTFYESINFFISATIFIWWLVTTPVVFFEIYFSSSDWSFVFLRWQVFLFMNMFMYLSFTFALVYCKPTYDK